MLGSRVGGGRIAMGANMRGYYTTVVLCARPVPSQPDAASKWT